MKKLVMLVITMILAVGAFSGTEVEAASKKATAKKAKKAYANYLQTDAKSTYHGTVDFGLIDLNKDGIPEMLLTYDDMYHLYIYAYVDGKVKLVCEFLNGNGCSFYPSRKVCYYSNCRMGWIIYCYYKFDGRKMSEVACKEGSDMYNAVTGKPKEIMGGSYKPYKYTIKGKRVTKKKYNKYIKNLIGKAKEKKPTMRKNTAKNRRKYLLK